MIDDSASRAAVIREGLTAFAESADCVPTDQQWLVQRNRPILDLAVQRCFASALLQHEQGNA